MSFRSIAAALAAAMLFGVGANAVASQDASALKLPPPAPVAKTNPVDAVPITPAGAPALTKQDLDAWLDGFLPYALASGDIAGGVVVVVKDGQVLTERGYGYADVKTRRRVDPAATLFRPGSISKLFTWTAVMQQVEAGRIDLDADVNRYLDFKIPPRDGQPVTMRQLMTHTGGFAETTKHIFPSSADKVPALRHYLSGWIPNRISAPGTTPAYSNYGNALAGYIVQRVSGEPFDAYVARHIFTPLGMNHSSFSQPLPPALLAGMSSGYLRASQPAVPYEFVGAAPPGSLASTGDDMAKFMIAHLNNGQLGSARILSEATARQMHAPQKQYVPPLNGMALGFYHEDRNGHSIVGHGGDLVAFHSDLHLLPDDHVGVFISMNSPGRNGAVSYIRLELLQRFMDRYFPAPNPVLPTTSTAKAHAQLMAGQYWSSRRSDTGFLRALNLFGQSKVTANADGTMTVSDTRDASGAPYVWREVAPFVWTDASNQHRLAAVVENGKVVRYAQDFLAPFMVSLPVPAWASASWNLPLLQAMIAVLLATVVLWPIQAIVRARHGRPFPLAGRTAALYCLVRATALVDLLALGGYAFLVSLIGGHPAMLDDPTDKWLRLLQLLCVIGVAGAGVAVWNAVRTWTEPGRSWWAKVSVSAIMAACLAFVWFVATLGLVSVGLDY